MNDKKVTCRIKRNGELCGLCGRCIARYDEECCERFEILSQPISRPTLGDHYIILVNDVTRLLVNAEDVYDIR